MVFLELFYVYIIHARGILVKFSILEDVVYNNARMNLSLN